ncbi:MAG: hypothetical protein HUU01_07340 [Saprospiraceae bacterium]|nr:hypothetical protein [Saprospiraceae bacterium]
MKTFHYFILAFAVLSIFSSCYTISYTHSFYKTPVFRRDASFKVISINSNDPLLGRLEHHLLKNGFKVVSDNYIRGEVPAGSTIVSTRDTTYQLPVNQSVTLRFAEESESDYVIKFQSRSHYNSNRISSLIINVVNVKNGQNEASFTFPGEGAYSYSSINVDEAIALFIAGLAGK